MKLLSLRQQRASLELEVETLKASVLCTHAAGNAEDDDAADAADVECAARPSGPCHGTLARLSPGESICCWMLSPVSNALWCCSCKALTPYFAMA